MAVGRNRCWELPWLAAGKRVADGLRGTAEPIALKPFMRGKSIPTISLSSPLPFCGAPPSPALSHSQLGMGYDLNEAGSEGRGRFTEGYPPALHCPTLSSSPPMSDCKA